MESYGSAVRNAFYAHYGRDPMRTIERRGLDWWRLFDRIERRVEYAREFRRTYDDYDALLEDERNEGYATTWRDLTRHHLLRHVEILGSLGAIDFASMRSMRIATRLRVLMQRFVGTLRRLAERTRRIRRARRIASDHQRAVTANLWSGMTWRGVTRYTLQIALRQNRSLARLPDDLVMDLMTATRFRYYMQRFARRLRIRLSTRFDLNDSD